MMHNYIQRSYEANTRTQFCSFYDIAISLEVKSQVILKRNQQNNIYGCYLKANTISNTRQIIGD